ncbi:MAG: DUF72 domain-containing protein [Armatimonadota bacterium]|nr:DUF72 domain-containing protein [Armatimonadota bacterium]
MARAWIGTSGYNYAHWEGVFYPQGLPARKWLSYYAQRFSIVELNVTFYRLPQKKTFETWAKTAPEGFVFVLKGSRFITHIKRLKETESSLYILFDQSSPLADRIAAVLWQLPPRFRADLERLESFLQALRASPLAQRYRHAFEFRDMTWFRDDIYEILKKHNAALVLADWPFQVLGPGMKAQHIDREAIQVPHTANFVYLRRHGPGALFSSNYPERMIKSDAEAIQKWLAEGREVYCFYNNDVAGYAVKNALKLKELVEGKGSAS